MYDDEGRKKSLRFLSVVLSLFVSCRVVDFEYSPEKGVGDGLVCERRSVGGFLVLSLTALIQAHSSGSQRMSLLAFLLLI